MTWAREYPLPANGQACVGAIADSIEHDLEEELGAERAKVESEYDGWYPPLEVEEIKADRERLLKACAEKDEEVTRLLGESSGMRSFCGRLRDAVDEGAEVDLWGRAYIALPVDAEGVPWRVGDVIAWPDGSGLKTVIGIGEDWLFYVDSKHEYKADWTVANDKRHHRVPTVEGILREFAEGMDEIASEYICEMIGGDERNRLEDEHIAKFAAKLRLAEEVDA